MPCLLKPLMLISLLMLPTGISAQAPDRLKALIDELGRGEVAPVVEALSKSDEGEVRTVLEAGLAASQLKPGVAFDGRLQKLAESEDPALRGAALSIITEAAFSDGHYAEAARAGRLLSAALTAAGEHEQVASAERTWRLAQLLAEYPPQQVRGALGTGTTAARQDKVGLPRIDVAVNGLTQEAVLDTGANLSVLSVAAARQLGVTIRQSETRIGNGVNGTVSVRVGIADSLEIAGTTLTNVVFLIIDDAQLSFPVPGGYEIKAIIGLPVLRALGRVRLERSGRFSVLRSEAASVRPAAPLRASGNDLFVEVTVGGHMVPLHLDTGASRTALSARYASVFPQATSGLKPATVQTASAGGARSQEVAIWPNAPFRLGGEGFLLHQLSVALGIEGPLPRFYGTLGSDALRKFESYTIDFTAMKLELGPIRRDDHE